MKTTLLISWLLACTCTVGFTQQVITGSNSSSWNYLDFSENNPRSTDVGWANPGNGARMLSISDPTAGLITDVNVSVSGITSTYIGDLLFVLEGPDGTMSGLMLADSSANLSNVNFTFDSDAGSNFFDVHNWGNNNSTTSNRSFTFQPTLDPGFPNVGNPRNYPGIIGEPEMSPFVGLTSTDFDLSLFNGKTASGDWTLHAYDIYDRDFSNVTGGWSLEITTMVAAVPEPGTYALILGLLAGGFVIYRRKRK